MLERAFWCSVLVGVTVSATLASSRRVSPQLKALKERFLYFLLRYGVAVVVIQFLFT